jgi:hypothetical protein
VSEASPRRLVTIKEFAEMIALGERTVSRLIAAGLPVIYTSPAPQGRHGRGVRIEPDAAIEFLRNRGQPQPPPPPRRGRPRKGTAR